MKLAGTFSVGSESYFIFVNNDSRGREYSCFGSMTKDDSIRVAMGDSPAEKVMHKVIDFSGDCSKYFVGRIRDSVSGKVSTAGNVNLLKQMLDLMAYARHYSFGADDVTVNSTDVEFGQEHSYFSAEDGTLSYKYEKLNSDVVDLLIRSGANQLKLSRTSKIPKVTGINLVERTDNTSVEVFRATAETIHYEDLDRLLDMSWYKDKNGVKKRYVPVHTVTEFENMFSEMMEDACNTNQLVVALDTETTGTVVFELAKDNPKLDHCVEISISWRDDEAYCIFTDMEYLESVSAEYCFKRLAEVFTESDEPRTLVWDGGRKSQKFARNRFHLVGQNFPFDKRVGMVEGYDLWFDDDTLVMGFNIDPKAVRGNVKLKNMTRRVFHHETPELTDVLGKGNEDKYRWLEDEEVACIYAGADADYTRKLFFVLKALLGERMYFQYHKQDVWLLNVLARSEYKGLRTQEDEARKLAKQTEENLKILSETAYKYVGAYMSFKQKADAVTARMTAGIISEEECADLLAKIKVTGNEKYEFEFKDADIRMVMYDILKYPIFARTDSGLAKVDKYVRKKLLKVKRTEGSRVRSLTHSVLVYGADYDEYQRLLTGTEDDKKKAEKMELISMKRFNEVEYPMALLFEQYANLKKEYTSYFKPILEGNLEAKIFKTYSLARIETRRIMNPSQTMKKDLKKLILPYSDDYYSLDFDLSQIELRLMYSMSGSTTLIEKMKNPEADAHTETAAVVNRIPAYEVTKEQRKGSKCISFGQPYGLGDGSLCEDIFGDRSKEHKAMTAVIIQAWKVANKNVVELLESARDQALEPITISLEKRNFMDAWQHDKETKEYLLDENGEKIPTPLGAVYNKLGFCRYFDLTEVDQSDAAKRRRKSGVYTSAESTIRRAAGNYPIQSYAAEFFRIILHRFYDRCKEEGIADKVIWNMLIHDELLASVHKSINPILMIKIVKEACMITMPGHTKYFVGINIGDNWKETKDDAREAPVIFANRLIKEWDAGMYREQTWFEHPWELIGPLRATYVKDRIHEVLLRLQPDLDEAPINLPSILKRFDNYTVRAYVNDYPKNFKLPDGVSEDVEDDLKYQSRFESWMLDQYGEGKELVDVYGKLKKVTRVGCDEEHTVSNEFDEMDVLDFADDGEDFDFDSDSVIETYLDDAAEVEEDDFAYKLENWDDAKNVADLTVVETKYKHLKALNDCLVISVNNDLQIDFLKRKLGTGKGPLVIFRKPDNTTNAWRKVESSVDLKALDNLVDKLHSVENLEAKQLQNRLIFAVNGRDDIQFLRQFVVANSGFGYVVMTKDSLGNLNELGQVAVDTNFNFLKRG